MFIIEAFKALFLAIKMYLVYLVDFAIKLLPTIKFFKDLSDKVSLSAVLLSILGIPAIILTIYKVFKFLIKHKIINVK